MARKRLTRPRTLISVSENICSNHRTSYHPCPSTHLTYPSTPPPRAVPSTAVILAIKSARGGRHNGLRLLRQGKAAGTSIVSLSTRQRRALDAKLQIKFGATYYTNAIICGAQRPSFRKTLETNCAIKILQQNLKQSCQNLVQCHQNP